MIACTHIIFSSDVYHVHTYTNFGLPLGREAPAMTPKGVDLSVFFFFSFLNIHKIYYLKIHAQIALVF